MDEDRVKTALNMLRAETDMLRRAVRGVGRRAEDALESMSHGNRVGQGVSGTVLHTSPADVERLTGSVAGMMHVLSALGVSQDDIQQAYTDGFNGKVWA